MTWQEVLLKYECGQPMPYLNAVEAEDMIKTLILFGSRQKFTPEIVALLSEHQALEEGVYHRRSEAAQLRAFIKDSDDWFASQYFASIVVDEFTGEVEEQYRESLTDDSVPFYSAETTIGILSDNIASRIVGRVLDDGSEYTDSPLFRNAFGIDESCDSEEAIYSKVYQWVRSIISPGLLISEPIQLLYAARYAKNKND